MKLVHAIDGDRCSKQALLLVLSDRIWASLITRSLFRTCFSRPDLSRQVYVEQVGHQFKLCLANLIHNLLEGVLSQPSNGPHFHFYEMSSVYQWI